MDTRLIPYHIVTPFMKSSCRILVTPYQHVYTCPHPHKDAGTFGPVCTEEFVSTTVVELKLWRWPYTGIVLAFAVCEECDAFIYSVF